MIIRQLKQEQYEQLTKELAQKAHAEPMEASYTVELRIGGASYMLKLQPESRHRIALLQACRIRGTGSGRESELITKGVILSALLELLIFQGIGANS